MQTDLVNWWDAFANAALSFLVAVIVGLIIRFKFKSKHEEIFDQNRNTNLAIIFDLLNQLDFLFEQYVITFESRLGEITKDRDSVLPKPEWKYDSDGNRIVNFTSSTEIRGIYDRLKNELKETVSSMYKISNDFRKDYNIFQNYIHADFLQNTSLYIFNTCFFSDWALKDSLVTACFTSRMEYAQNLIQYVERDKSIKTSQSSINDFMDRWNKEFRKFSN